MPRTVSVRRYAQAVFDLGLENGELDKWYDDLSVLANAVSNEQFLIFLNQPRISTSRKIEVVREALRGAVGPKALNLIAILATRNLAGILPDVTDQYQMLLDGYHGIERAEVISAIKLSTDEENRVVELLSKMTGSEIQLTTRVDNKILGGMIIRINDRVIDGSTGAKLRAMRQGLVERR